MRHLRQPLLIIAATMVLYVVLYWLTQRGFDPVRFVAAVPIDLTRYYHGQPALSGIGVTTWIVAVALYALCVAATTRSRLRYLPLAICVLCLSVMYLCLVHPRFVLTVLPDNAAHRFAAAIQSYVPPLRALYFGWNPFHLWPYVMLVHVLLVYTLVSMLQHKDVTP
ncbi:MAG TPA: hypothetical protein VJ901_22610 [Thermoanaerobaculia bacterium]|nr:hypothetical protein [Thermoanaerobaculia bacterium]